MLKGVSDGTNPTQAVTREQFATMLYRYVKEIKGGDVTVETAPAFPDSASVADWAKTELEWATANKIVNGMDGKLEPKANTTRVQVAQMLYNYAKLAA